ncbi:MAG: hypothetical protein JWM44_3563 [Bacilli bacterium]|nr:hypothetical protein [Bacilli bacterium]
MEKTDKPALDQERLVSAWQRSLPTWINEGDHAEVAADTNNPLGLQIYIDSAGRSLYSFDFICEYLDSREVKVVLAGVMRDHKPIEKHTEAVEQLVKDYVRNIHECAQALHELTHS